MIETFSKHAHIPLEPEGVYHIYNRGNNRENLFLTNSHYSFFRYRFQKYLSNFVDTYSYCLLPNHFHFLVKIKPEDQILHTISNLQSRHLTYLGSKHPGLAVSDRFRVFLMSYAKMVNSRCSREGSLFRKVFRRKFIQDNDYLLDAIMYIHLNPVKHQLTHDFEKYRWSSYREILSKKKSFVMQNEVISWFDDRNSFQINHRMMNRFINRNRVWEID